MRPVSFSRALPMALLLAAHSIATASAEEAGTAAEDPAATSQPALLSLIHTLPDYSGDLMSRNFLTGDWGGTRTAMAEDGVIFELSVTQVMQGNAHGGKDTEKAFSYEGSADYTLKLDTARMKLWPGGLLKLRGETQFGRAINGKAGALMAPNFDALLPVPGDPGITTLSEFYVVQALSEKLVLLAGKLDLSTGDENVFAHDEKTQFLNLGFRLNPILFPAGPYTTMAAGAILLPTEWLRITTMVCDNDPEGAVKATGFNTAFHGRNWLSVLQEYDFTIKPFEQTGHQRFGWFWSSRDYTDFQIDARLQLPYRTVRLDRVVPNVFPRQLDPSRLLGGKRNRFLPKPLRSQRLGSTLVEIETPEPAPDGWAIYYNFDQYFYTEEQDPEQGWGLFGRFGWSTGESNPIEEFYSIGLGGRGAIPTRDRDTWGLGYYLLNTTDDLPAVLGMNAEQGVELFYNIEITKWLSLTPDLQVIIDPAAGFQDRDVAIVYGLRAQVNL